MSRRRWLLLAAIVVLVAGFFLLDLDRHFTLEAFQSRRSAIEAYTAAHFGAALAAYFAIYVAVTALSLPGALILTLAGGAIFGIGWGLLVVSFASTIGATLAFLASRFLLRDAIQARYGTQLQAFNDGIAREGAFYLFTLRLVPVPFFLVNLLMGLTPIPVRTFYWVSQLGMLAGTAVYVNAGTQLGAAQNLSELVSWKVLGSLALLGVFPLLAKRLAGAISHARSS